MVGVENLPGLVQISSYAARVRITDVVWRHSEHWPVAIWKRSPPRLRAPARGTACTRPQPAHGHDYRFTYTVSPSTRT